jgi:hypothetical protein
MTPDFPAQVYHHRVVALFQIAEMEGRALKRCTEVDPRLISLLQLDLFQLDGVLVGSSNSRPLCSMSVLLPSMIWPAIRAMRVGYV